MDLGLAFGELEALAGPGLPRLLPFSHPRVPGQEAFFLQRRPHIQIKLEEGARDPEPDRPSLSFDASTNGLHANVERIGCLRHFEWFQYDQLKRRRRKILFERASVHLDLSGSPG